MQHQITERKPLLDESGRLAEAGYSKSMLLEYSRDKIKAGKLRIKEWDYYLITDGKVGVALTVADNSYMGLDSISFLDFEKPWEKTVSPMRIMPMGKTKLPPTSEDGDTCIKTKNYEIQFKKSGNERILTFHMENFHMKNPINGKIILKDEGDESMVIATPFAEKENAFYYNQKINCMPATGYVEIYGRKHEFDPNRAFGVLDWGRGVWTYKNTWYWGSASGKVDGVSFGFNIGYGFGDTSAASENMLFYNGKAHKLSQVRFNIPTDAAGKEAYMERWTFTSDDGRFEMDFEPIIDRAANTDFKILCSKQHQVFGKFSGKAILDDGREIVIKDFFGFAEKVFNKW